MERTAGPRLYGQITTNFPTMYLTVISVIQGAAFSLFMSGLVGRGTGLIPQSALDWVVYAIILLVIIIIWFEYMIAALGFVWIPGMSDSIIPFIKGAIEYAFIYYSLELMKDPGKSYGWLFLFAALCLDSIWAYRNMYLKARKLPRENGAVFDEIERKEGQVNFVRFTESFLAVVAFSCLVAFCFSWLFKTITYELNFIYCIVVFLFVSGYAIRGVFYWRRIISVCASKPTCVETGESKGV